MPEESRMPKAQLSGAGRGVRGVKTASQRQDEALTGRNRGEGMARLTDFDAQRGPVRLRTPTSPDEMIPCEITVLTKICRFAHVTNTAGF